MIATGRERLKLDAQARKALRFIDEFENSGRGWFWETNAQGTLSYVSRQLADDFSIHAQWLTRQCEAAHADHLRSQLVGNARASETCA